MRNHRRFFEFLFFASILCSLGILLGVLLPSRTIMGMEETKPALSSRQLNGDIYLPIFALRDESAITFTYEDVPVGQMESGHIFRGQPDAPITIYEYSDYQCPFCVRHFNQTLPSLITDYVSTGQVRLVYADFPLTQIHPNAPAASAAALCAADQNLVAFWHMHALLFENQSDWATASDPQAEMRTLVEQLVPDVESFDVGLFDTCVSSGEKDDVIDASIAEAKSFDFGGTPSFRFVHEESGESYNLVGAQPYLEFQVWIDALLAGDAPDGAGPDPSDDNPDNEIPYWATEEGLSPDPDRAGYTLAGDQYRGDIGAEVTVIEFTDFQCPFCERHVRNTQPTLDETFVDTGQVRWVFKHFPLNIHAQAVDAGIAAECAAEQSKFWEMHDKLFSEMSSWSISEPDTVFIEMADELDLDTDAFETCLDDEEIATRVDSDVTDGRPFVQGTPTFIVMAGEDGRIIPGALSVDQFVDAIQSVLDSLP